MRCTSDLKFLFFNVCVLIFNLVSKIYLCKSNIRILIKIGFQIDGLSLYFLFDMLNEFLITKLAKKYTNKKAQEISFNVMFWCVLVVIKKDQLKHVIK